MKVSVYKAIDEHENEFMFEFDMEFIPNIGDMIRIESEYGSVPYRVKNKYFHISAVTEKQEVVLYVK